jgi:hypothetical protein
MEAVIRALKAFGAVAATAAALAAGGVMAAGLSTGGPGPKTARAVASACTQDPIQVSLTTTYSASLQGYGVTGITLTDTASSPSLGACAGAPYRVTLLGTGGATLAAVSGVVPAGATSFSPAAGLASPVDPTTVSGVSLAIGG